MSNKHQRKRGRQFTITVTTAELAKAARRTLYAAERKNHVGVLRKAATFDIKGKDPRTSRREAKDSLRQGKW